jgi:hypothetical protein
MIHHSLSLPRAAALAVAVAACSTEPTAPKQGVMLLTDAREYQVAQPNRPGFAIFATVSNQTVAGVPVRRCLIQGNADFPVGVDLVLEQALANGSWQAVDLGFACLNSTAPRADVVLAPREVALVARIVPVTAGQFRIRMGYGALGDTAPVDTVTSAVFTVR